MKLIGFPELQPGAVDWKIPYAGSTVQQWRGGSTQQPLAAVSEINGADAIGSSLLHYRISLFINIVGAAITNNGGATLAEGRDVVVNGIDHPIAIAPQTPFTA